MKTCNCCKKELPVEMFHNDIKGKDGKARACKACRLAQNRAWHLKNPDKAKECWRRSSKKRYNCRAQRIKKYDLNEDEFTDLINFSKDRCNICDAALENHGHIDHCHKTNHVRGLLCGKCNTAIGSFRDDAALLSRAIEYISSSGFWRSSHSRRAPDS